MDHNENVKCDQEFSILGSLICLFQEPY
jgi:hypothetical protein